MNQNSINKLDHLNEFNQILARYTMSQQSLHSLSQTQLVLLVAPTSCGRNTLLRELIKSGDYYLIVSDTTRSPRINDGILEQNGVEYWFRTEQEVLQDLQNGAFLEAAVIHQQQVSGISIRELQQAHDAGLIAISDTDIAGMASASVLKSDTIGIFVLPPNFEEWQRRLKHRGAMEAEEYKRRMQSAIIEFEAALEHEYFRFVINDDLEQAVINVNEIVKLDLRDAEHIAAGRNLAEQLLVDTRLLVKSL